MQKKGQMTAYEYNTRKQVGELDIQSDWSERITELLKKQHTFLPMTYQRGGYLFRGMTHGFFQSVEQGHFGKFEDDNPHSTLESELNVVFVSHELSDALTCARPWESSSDFVVLVIASDLFIQENLDKNAAMMAFSEPGFVFKYPFFIRDLLVEEISYLVISEATRSKLLGQMPEKFSLLEDRLIVVEVGESQNSLRKQYEDKLKEQFEKKQVKSAKTIHCEVFPR